MKFIIYNPATNLFDFFIHSLYHEFKYRSIEYLLLDNNINDYYNYEDIINYKKDILLIIVNPHFIFNNMNIKNKLDYFSSKFKYKILYITEPINFIIEKKVYEDIIKIIKPFTLWTYTISNFNKLNNPQKIFKIFPNFNDGNKFIDDINIDNLKNRIKDKIIFFGNINENRKYICNQFNNYLINKTDVWDKSEWTNILNNNLFYLNIHRRLNCKSFESFRIIPILSNGGVIFSERCNDIEEALYSKFNIIFVDRYILYETFLNYIENISYDDIYNKTLLFRESMNNCYILDEFIKYFKLL